MTSSLVIANFKTGYETDREPFLVNNDAFPVLNNAYVWRGRLKKKRGTSLLGRLQRTTDAAGNLSGGTVTLTAPVVPGTVSIVVGANTYTDPGKLGVLVGAPGGSGTINYATGLVTITGGAGSAFTATFDYYPSLPVMGLEDFFLPNNPFPALVAFDTRFSYQFNQSTNNFYDVTFYKASGAPFEWTGTDYEQFWSTNYSGAMWVTNQEAGFHFATITAFADLAASTAAVVTLDNPNLLVGDKLFFYEITAAVATDINGVVGTITNNAFAPMYDVTLDTPATVTTFASGIVQLLTNSRPGTGNGIKFYDGDPSATTTVGWVNFAPPLSNLATPQYLIGAKIVIPFKNRLLFFGVTIATSAAPAGVFYQNRMVYSEDGTPYYNSLVPINQVFEPKAWFQNVAGFGGFIGAPIPQKIVTVDDNGDVLLTGYETKQLKLIFTGDDSFPFVYQTINSELGSLSTFSGIALDTGTISIGEYGIAMTTQESAQRIDLVIPDQVFDISGLPNAEQRVTAIRDFRNEFIYFTYPPTGRQNNTFNSRTLLYNYRDNTWATFDENYTHYGTFRRTMNKTWATLNRFYATWSVWTDPWNFGSTAARYPNIIGGNQQGFVMIKDEGTGEGTSQYISAFDPTTDIVTSPNHCLNTNDYIEILNAVGTTNLNEEIYQISVIDANNFKLLLNFDQQNNPPAGTYLGNGVYRRLTNISIRSRQFPIFWERARKTRVGTQRFFIQNAPNSKQVEDLLSQITLQIFTSQNNEIASNDPNFGYLIFSNIILTGPEPMEPFQEGQNQIWHRMSDSFIGDTVQFGFVLSDAQMRNNHTNSAEIIIHAIAFDLYPGPILA